MLRTIACVAVVGLGFGAAWAQQPAAGGKHEEHRQPAANRGPAPANGAAMMSPAAAAFERLKGLAGEWKGTGKHGEEVIPEVTVRYALTAGGSAVVETEFPGTEHEMTTVYTMDGDDLAMTHYCMLGNQPRMVAKPNGGSGALKFECVSVANCGSDDAPAMRSLALTFDGADRLKQEWGMHEKGACTGTAVFELQRVKGAAPETYYVVFLTYGPNWPKEQTPEQQKLIGEHKSHIAALQEKGVIRAAGPFADGFGGMTVMKAESADAALALAKDDPAVKAGLFEASVHPWRVVAGKVE